MIDSLPPAPHKRKRVQPLWFIVGILVIGALAWTLYPAPAQQSQGGGGGRHGRGGKTNNNAVIPVAVATIQRGDIDVILHALGTVTPLANVTVRTQVNGQLMEVGFKEGQIVQKGDFLAQIDPRPFQTALEQAEGALQRDQAQMKDAQLNLERFRKLWEKDSISKQQVDTQAALVDQYAGNVVTDQGQIDAANLNLTYAHIIAPIRGRVGLRQIDAGNYAQTSDTNGIVTLTQLQPITVAFTLPEDNVPTVMKLFMSGAELEATAYDRTQSIKLATGKLSATDNQIDTSTGTVKLKAEFDNQDNALFPNQFVNVALKTSSEHDAIIAPAASIQHGIPGTFVYKLKEDDNTVTVQPVKLGTMQGDNVAITDGLQPGDKVVTEGVDKLRDGAHVSVK